MLVALLLVGCGGELTAQEVGNADERTVIAATVGSSYDLEVLAQAGDLSDRNYKALRVELEAGQTVAAIMRRSDDSDLDAYLALYLEPERDARAKSVDEQALVPMAASTDAVIVWYAERAASYVLFAADRDLDTSAAFQIDLVEVPAMTEPLALHVTNAGLRALRDDLHSAEPEVARLIGLGALEEGAAGLLVTHPAALPALAERAELQRLAARVNVTRETLFEELVRANSSADDGPLATSIGALCGTLWRELRGPEHALR